ncbi:MAG: V-type ATP synthase subunit I [Bacillota bacterium]
MIVKMSRITVLGMEDQRRALIGSLMDIGAVEISEIDLKEYESIASNPSVQAEITDIGSKLADVRAALAVLEKYCPVKRGLFQSRREITLSEFNQILEKKDLTWDSVKKIREQEERLVRLKSEENKLDNMYLALLPWKSMDVPIQSTGTKKTAFVMGTVPASIDWEAVSHELSEKVPLATAEKVNSDADQHYITVIYHRDTEQECVSFLKSYGFNKAGFPGIEGTVAENLEMLKSRLQELEAEREEAIGLIKSQEGARESMEVLYDALNMEQSRLTAMQRILKTERVFMIKGWIPETLSERVKAWLESQYTAYVDIREPAEDEEFPVLLENNGFAEAGEPVTTMYGLPNSREIDPNAVMTPFFVIFFGMMLSDGGYGLVMSLITGLALWKLKLDRNKRKFVKLLFFCGLSTVFWGAMFGGWFGISFFTKYAVWFDAGSNPELLLSWSLLFGIIHLFAGLGLKAANMIRRGQYLDALLDVGVWYVVFTGFAMFLLPNVPKVDPVKIAPIAEAGKYVLAAGAVLVILTQGRDKKNIIAKLFGGVAKLYDIVGFFSDVLSYSRLMALGIATSVIASIINQMAFMFDMPGLIKIIVGGVILIVGHAVDFAINALGAYVHSCRLQFLEFFGKFYEGGGEAFEPFKAETEYILIKPGSTL